jgi:hypothetical protein
LRRVCTTWILLSAGRPNSLPGLLGFTCVFKISVLGGHDSLFHRISRISAFVGKAERTEDRERWVCNFENTDSNKKYRVVRLGKHKKEFGQEINVLLRKKLLCEWVVTCFISLKLIALPQISPPPQPLLTNHPIPPHFLSLAFPRLQIH